MSLDGQCIMKQEYIKHLILNWSPLPLLPCPLIQVGLAGDHSFITFAKSSEKLTFLTP